MPKDVKFVIYYVIVLLVQQNFGQAEEILDRYGSEHIESIIIQCNLRKLQLISKLYQNKNLNMLSSLIEDIDLDFKSIRCVLG